MFTKSDVLLISKTDTISVFDFDFDKCEERARKLNPDIKIFRVSAKTGDGMDAWEAWLKDAIADGKASGAAADGEDAEVAGHA